MDPPVFITSTRVPIGYNFSQFISEQMNDHFSRSGEIIGDGIAYFILIYIYVMFKMYVVIV